MLSQQTVLFLTHNSKFIITVASVVDLLLLDSFSNVPPDGCPAFAKKLVSHLEMPVCLFLSSSCYYFVYFALFFAVHGIFSPLFSFPVAMTTSGVPGYHILSPDSSSCNFFQFLPIMSLCCHCLLDLSYTWEILPPHTHCAFFFLLLSKPFSPFLLKKAFDGRKTQIFL